MSSNLPYLNKDYCINDSVKSSYEDIEITYSRVDVITNTEEFFAIREEWSKINATSDKGTTFNSWEWVYSWWETYKNQGNRKLYILKCVDENNNLIGIAPLQIVTNPKKYFPCSRQLIMLATGETDGSSVFGEYMDLIIKEGNETTVISALTNYLSRNNDLWDGMKFQQQLAGSYISKIFSTTENMPNTDNNIIQTVVENGFRTYIDLPETYKDYLMSLRKKMRNNITRTHSRLESEKDFTITEVSTDTEEHAQTTGKDSAIEILAKLNRTRRGNMDKDSVFSKTNFELFHQRLVKRLLPLDKVSLRIMNFDDEPVAALYSFKDKDTVHAYQSGFETDNGHRYSLLTNMLTHEISKSIEDDELQRFNFMYSDKEDTYKGRYSGTTEQMYDISYDKVGIKFTIYEIIHGPIKELVKKLFKIT